MKKMILAFAATMMMTAAMAQDDNQQGRQERRRMDRTEMIKNRTDRTVKQYGLNEEQAKQLDTVILRVNCRGEEQIIKLQ